MFMGIIYLLMNQHTDVRHYSWNTVSGAICNFMGALIAKSWGDNVAAFFPGAGQQTIFLVWTACVASWFVLLQIVLAFTAGAYSGSVKHYNVMILNLKCEGVLLGLVTGVSSMNMWGTFQQLNFSTVHWVIPFAALTLWCCFKITHLVRKGVARVDEAWVDKYEKAWDKYAEQTEDSVMNLTIAHITVQAIRFYISGSHPLANGADRAGFHPKLSDFLYLECWALAFLFVYLVAEPLLPGSWHRGKPWIKGILANSAVFAGFWASKWAVDILIPANGNNATLVLALLISAGSSVFLWIAHNVSKLKCMPKYAEKEIKALVGPYSFLIGFAWKQATLSSIAVIVKSAEKLAFLRPERFELILAIAVCAFIVPAWRWYILPVILVMEENPKVLPSEYRALGSILTNDNNHEYGS
mmetsp:Transcript_21406/g.38194  ORF Transcript_21406/g.38194 Transcript_21406/m.38194 type:complete len:412 (+) Transcript_21406:3-1238(+)